MYNLPNFSEEKIAPPYCAVA